VADESALDPRIRRTRRVLQEAVLTLAEERDFSEITVRDITARADVNRATFYLHYRNKEDLVAQALDALFDEFTAEERAFVAAHGRLTPDVVPPPMVDLFRHAADRSELYRRLLGESGPGAFASRLRAFHEQAFLVVWHDMGLAPLAGSAPPDLRARVAAAAAEGAIRWWLDCGKGDGAETTAAWMWKVVRPLLFEDRSPRPKRDSR
jgi:AcrR family transcriptional regulator